MNTVINKWTVWFWQLWTINRLRKAYCRGWLGYYSFLFNSDGSISDVITYVDIKPWLGKKTLKHELGHKEVTHQCHDAETAQIRNDEWDQRSWHGILFWKKP